MSFPALPDPPGGDSPHLPASSDRDAPHLPAVSSAAAIHLTSTVTGRDATHPSRLSHPLPGSTSPPGRLIRYRDPPHPPAPSPALTPLSLRSRERGRGAPAKFFGNKNLLQKLTPPLPRPQGARERRPGGEVDRGSQPEHKLPHRQARNQEHPKMKSGFSHYPTAKAVVFLFPMELVYRSSSGG